MAGPTSSILFDSIPSELTWEEIENMIKKVSNKVDGNDFWVINTESINGTVSTAEGRPFGIVKHKIDADYYEYTEKEILQIKDYFGFNPKFDLGIYAMCNREIDHKILGEITLYLSEKFNGLIDFGGHLTCPIDKMNGETWEILYETSGGMTAVYNVADVDFMKEWLNHKNFRMIK